MRDPYSVCIKGVSTAEHLVTVSLIMILLWKPFNIYDLTSSMLSCYFGLQTCFVVYDVMSASNQAICTGNHRQRLRTDNRKHLLLPNGEKMRANMAVPNTNQCLCFKKRLNNLT